MSSGLSADNIYHILMLAPKIGSPQVLLDIADMYRSLSEEPDMTDEMSMMAKANWLYDKAEGLFLKGHAPQRVLVIHIYKEYKLCMNTIKSKRKSLKKDVVIMGTKPKNLRSPGTQGPML